MKSQLQQFILTRIRVFVHRIRPFYKWPALSQVYAFAARSIRRKNHRSLDPVQPPPKKKKNIFAQCLLISFLFHVCLIAFLWSYPFIIDSLKVSFFTHFIDPTHLTTLASQLDFSDRNKILEEAFEEIVIAPSPIKVAEPVPMAFEPVEEKAGFHDLPQEFYPPLQLQAVSEEKEKGFPFYTLPKNDIAFKEQSPPISSPLKIQPASSPDWIEELISEVKTSVAPIIEENNPSATVADLTPQPEKKTFHPKPAPGPLLTALPQLPQESPSFECKNAPKDTSQEHLMTASTPIPVSAKKGKTGQKKVNRNSLAPYLDELNDLSWEDHFDMKLAGLPQKEKGEYLFSITLKAHPNQYFEKIPQNFYFLIDRSHAISKFRFQTFCNATLKSLPYLKEGDTFNIILFDQKIKVLSETSLAWNKASMERAKLFLKSQESGGFFSSTDLVEVFNFLLKNVEKGEGLHTAILLSDGDTSHSLKSQINSIREFTEINGGDISFYTAMAGDENNSSVMELIATFNRGELIHSQTHAAFPRKLARLVKTLDTPIAGEMTFSAASHDPDLKIQFYPPLDHLPNMYLDQPYTIYGVANRPSDFILFVQAKAGEKRVTLKRNISLEHIPLANSALVQEVASKKACEFYKKYLSSKDSLFLKKASDLLKSHSLQTTIE